MNAKVETILAEGQVWRSNLYRDRYVIRKVTNDGAIVSVSSVNQPLAAAVIVDGEKFKATHHLVKNPDGTEVPPPIAASPSADGFRPGTTVQLNSGGPAMTVYSETRGLPSVDGAVNVVRCGWFTADGEYRTGEFLDVCLHPIHLDEGSP